jgi:hypothetical protein
MSDLKVLTIIITSKPAPTRHGTCYKMTHYLLQNTFDIVNEEDII